MSWMMYGEERRTGRGNEYHRCGFNLNLKKREREKEDYSKNKKEK